MSSRGTVILDTLIPVVATVVAGAIAALKLPHPRTASATPAATCGMAWRSPPPSSCCPHSSPKTGQPWKQVNDVSTCAGTTHARTTH